MNIYYIGLSMTSWTLGNTVDMMFECCASLRLLKRIYVRKNGVKTCDKKNFSSFVMSYDFFSFLWLKGYNAQLVELKKKSYPIRK